MNSKNILLLVVLFITVIPTFSQEESVDTIPDDNTLLWPYMETVRVEDSLKEVTPVTYWTKGNQLGLDVNEVAFKNWNAGGSNSISFLLSGSFRRTYERKSIRWKNELIVRYGHISEKGEKLKKTDDRIEFNSTFGYRPNLMSAWFISSKFNFKSQFTNGYDYPNRDKAISHFMAPGYLFLGVGAELGRDSDSFALYLSPSTVKTTFVLNQRLADEGAYGVRAAEYDGNDNVIRRGKKNHSEFGVLVTNEYNVEVFKNINLLHRLNLYTDYIKDFGNIDIDWEVVLNFKVNNYVTAKIGSHLKYDDATKTTRTNEFGEEYKGGAKVQWKQELGIGVVLDI